ncbi:MAG: exodeoxyribonuclease subunit alpha [Actinomycetota bacterium]
MKTFIDAGLFTDIDVEAALQVMQLAEVSAERTDVCFILAMTTKAFRDGHACLAFKDLEKIREAHPTVAFPSDQDLMGGIKQCSEIFGSAESLNHVPRPPYVFDNEKVYIGRVFTEEKFVADFLRANASRVRIVLGGPGTGKTTWVAQTLSQISDSDIKKLALCAPTGKAAQRMREVLDVRLRESGASEKLLEALNHAPSETAHKLLQYAPHRQPQFQYQGTAKLEYEVVIVDEASMMALSTMYRLLNALRPEAELWLVGDPDQLASVEAGSVLADIARGAEDPKSPIHNRVIILTEQHRFDAKSSIALLADAVRRGARDEVASILQSPSGDFVWIDSSKHLDELDVIGKVVIEHSRAIANAAAAGDAAKALQLKSELQVLSATRKGRLGIEHWNSTVEGALGASTAQRWYLGRPVMVTRNDRSMKLSNGDVGIVCATSDTMRGYFNGEEGPRDVSLARLPHVETVHALTIHKSQGSEYDHAIVVIPDAESRIVTRELLYTGITRPKKKLTLIGSLETILRAVETEIRRASGLEDHLK